jgi:ribosomal protein L37AE/L43A
MLICSTFGGKRVIPSLPCEKSKSDFSAMNTPAEIGMSAKALGWLKRLWQYGERIGTLESRVTTLEEALKIQPADACPYCGARAMRLSEQSPLMGDPGKQWTQDVWTCKECGKSERRRKKL